MGLQGGDITLDGSLLARACAFATQIDPSQHRPLERLMSNTRQGLCPSAQDLEPFSEVLSKFGLEPSQRDDATAIVISLPKL